MYQRKISARHWLIFGLTFCLSALTQPTWAAVTSSQFGLGGFLNPGSPASFDLAALENYAATHSGAQKTVTLSNGDVYTGVSLSAFLGSFLKTDTTVPKNDILRDYVVASGTDGYKAVFSLAEMNAAFGNHNDIIAYKLNGANLIGTGFARIVAPDDVKAGRWVSNLYSLQVGHIDYAPAVGGVSGQFTVNGEVASAVSYDVTSLAAALPAKIVNVNTPPLTGSSFTGVSLWDLLNLSGIVTNPGVKNDILGKYVVATGSDGYQAVFALGELNPNFGNISVLVAYADGSGNSLGNKGFAELVVPGDVAKGGRYVSNLTSLTVVSTVPLPGSVLFMFSGLLAFGLRRHRKPS
ncbi:molybdopterin-binding oxidoreductase [Methylomonas sp. Kb3]|uniref:molybdopterin-binding oxidoreductase n=1 Tax=Methylomonas sp. Kb3 TaxID=1611544 RepID=UPI000C321E74|nr:molybdopterin-binding oxidoreductase [Methylomonas sp. Kb3]PKD39008.1 molybdopterin-binding oxidoreductase [Methylomonas sp. Kb3]